MQVYVAVNQWKQLLPAKEQVRRNIYQAANPANKTNGASSSLEATERAVEDSDDELVMAEKLTLDQVIEASLCFSLSDSANSLASCQTQKGPVTSTGVQLPRADLLQAWNRITERTHTTVCIKYVWRVLNFPQPAGFARFQYCFAFNMLSIMPLQQAVDCQDICLCLLQRQHEEAKRTGCFIDLTSMDDDADEEVQQAHVAIKREEAAEAAEKKQAAIVRTKTQEEKMMKEVVGCCNLCASWPTCYKAESPAEALNLSIWAVVQQYPVYRLLASVWVPE